jgi:AraC-like DNA-binding protein
MTPATAAPTSMRISSDAMPERERLAFTREVYGRQVLRIDIEVERDTPFRFDLQLHAFPGLKIVSGFLGGLRASRRGNQLADGDDICITLNHAGHAVVDQRGRQSLMAPGDVHVGACGEPISFLHSDQCMTGLLVPRRALSPLSSGFDDRIGRLLDRSSPALRLLSTYVRTLCDARPEPRFEQMAVAHIHDLLALAMGATSDAQDSAIHRGVQGARLVAVKSHVASHLGRPGLSIGAVAKHHHLTPRAVQRLFEAQGTTFSAFVLEQRLGRAYRLLSDPRLRDRNISAIAFDSGFSDVSYFNRTFRKRFGAAPGELRAGAMRN